MYKDATFLVTKHLGYYNLQKYIIYMFYVLNYVLRHTQKHYTQTLYPRFQNLNFIYKLLLEQTNVSFNVCTYVPV